MLALLSLAAEEPSKAPFEILAAILVLWAVVMSGIGIANHETFPPSRGAQVGLILITVVLVAATMTMAVVTA